MNEEKTKREPEEGPSGIDRWSSNGYGLRIDGKEVISPTEKEDVYGNKTPENAAHKR